MPRRNFTLTIIKARQAHAHFQCEGVLENGQRCPALLTRGRFHADHNIPDQLGGPPTFENCRCLCIPCHKAKTALDMVMISKAKRTDEKHMAVRKSVGPDRKLQGAPFATTSKAAARSQRIADRLPVPRVRMPQGFVSAGDRIS